MVFYLILILQLCSCFSVYCVSIKDNPSIDVHDEDQLSTSVQQLKVVMQHNSKFEQFTALLEKHDIDVDVVVDSIIDAYLSGHDRGKTRLKLFEHFIKAECDADMLAYYFAEGGSQELLEQYDKQGGSLKIFEQVFEGYSLESVQEVMNMYILLVKQKGVERGKKYLKSVLADFEK